jgi:hypothetical protein
MGYAGDNTPAEAASLLECILKSSHSLLMPNAYAGFFWTFRNLDLAMDIGRSCGLTYRRVVPMYIRKGGARPFLGWLPRTQPFVVFQKYLPKPPPEFHTELATEVNQRMKESGETCSSLANKLACDSRLIMKWSRVGDPAWCLPTARFYPRLKELLGLPDIFDGLLDREHTDTRRKDFEYRHDCYVVDSVRSETINHPSPKPIEVMKHIVHTLCSEGGRVMDPTMGSGTTGVACMNTGRRFIGIERDEKYFEIAKARITDAYEP